LEGGPKIKQILRLRLPELLAGKVPPLPVELGAGVILALVAFAVRYALTPLIGDVAPYAFVFAAVTIAAVIAGWRSGLVTLIVGQALVWLGILAPLRDLGLDTASTVGGLFVSTISQLIVLATIAFYQREVDKGIAASEQRLALLDEALREIDHRTRNNYQTVLALVELQARRSTDENVRRALVQVADRIQAIAKASQQLAVHSAELGLVRLDDHLCGLVRQIERGISRKEILVKCEVDDVTASADKATSISIIVNELVTNAIKHAFNGDSSGHVWVTGKTGRMFELVVADDGRGIEASRQEGHDGLGSKLVEGFAKQLGAEHDVVSSRKGTRHRLVIPRLD
jgi:two-component sensor histidine kinase